MLDIFHLDGERTWRGGEVQLLYLAAGLRALGHSNIIACRPGTPLSREAKRRGFEVLESPFYWEGDPVTIWKVARALKRARRPVLHAHTAHAAGIAALLKAMTGVPVLAARQVDFPVKNALSRRFKYGSADAIVSCSGFVKKVLENSGVRNERMLAVPGAVPVGEKEHGWAGLEPGAFSLPDAGLKKSLREEISSRFGVPDGMPWVGNLAALVPHKDQGTFVEAAARVLESGLQAAFLIAGEGPLRSELERKIAEKNLRGRVFLLGALREPLTQDFLKSLDLFVLSSWGEGLGIVILEAMACGLPVVATSAGGIPELVRDGETGLLSSPRDAAALASNIARLLRGGDLARGLAARALEGLPAFGIERFARAFAGVYESILKNGAAR